MLLQPVTVTIYVDFKQMTFVTICSLSDQIAHTKCDGVLADVFKASRTEVASRHWSAQRIDERDYMLSTFNIDFLEVLAFLVGLAAG